MAKKLYYSMLTGAEKEEYVRLANQIEDDGSKELDKAERARIHLNLPGMTFHAAVAGAKLFKHFVVDPKRFKAYFEKVKANHGCDSVESTSFPNNSKWGFVDFDPNE